MMKKLLLTALSSMLAAIVMMAAPVSREEAQQKAADFLKSQSKRPAGKMRMAARQQRLTPANGEEHAYWYAFNLGDNQGFVIVSGDDRTDAILGYSDSGSIDEANMSDNLRAWLQGYADEIKYIDEHHLDAAAVRGSGTQRRAHAKTEVAPMMETMWNQDAPYYLETPQVMVTVRYQDGTIKKVPYHCVTGCVATAMAQVMYYQYRKTGKNTEAYVSIPAYTPNTSYFVDPEDVGKTTQTVNALPATTFAWNDMQTIYGKTADENNPTAAEAAVAKLMRYCGQSVEMGYKRTSSGAQSNKVTAALRNYFGYDDAVTYVERNNYLYVDWLDLVYQELITNGPVYYSGQSSGGGHAFVIDGYQSDDYFHVNWGWGGSSNGHFKLSVLYSDEQGIGGSSSGDGFSHDQSAIINVRPIPDSNISPKVLTVKNLYTTATEVALGSSITVTASRWNFTGETVGFSRGYGLYDMDGKLLKVLQSSNVTLNNSTGWNALNLSVTIPTDLGNGDYLLYAISKESSSDIWEKDNGSNLYFISLTISGGKAVFASGQPVLSASIVSCPSPIILYQPCNIEIVVTNNGNLYSGDVKLVLDNNNNRLAATQVEIANGQTKSYSLTINPSNDDYVGNHTLIVLDKYNKELTNMQVTIENSTATSDLELTARSLVSNLNSDMKLIGKKVKATVTYVNDNSQDYSGTAFFAVWEEWSDWGYTFYTKPLYVPAGESTTIEIESDELTEIDSNYEFDVYYIKGTQIQMIQEASVFITGLAPSVSVYQPDGTITYAEATETFAVPATATSVDFTGSGVATVTPNDNPNTLYFFGANETAAGLDGKNVVKNGVAEQITITDGQNFAAPMAFTATNISYSRKETTLAADGTNGWSTIVLPFEATTVTADGEPIDWFHRSTDTGKNFWLKAFVTDNEDNVYFDFAERLEANTPYIIALPGAKWGANWNLMNKEIKFSAQNAIVQATEWTQVNGGSYKFVGTMKTDAVQDVYALNTAGNLFQHAEAAAMTPFRAYFAANKWLAPYRELHVASVVNIDPSGGVATGLPADPIAVQTEQSSAAEVYDLQGRRVTQPAQKGVYIVNGRKRVVK